MEYKYIITKRDELRHAKSNLAGRKKIVSTPKKDFKYIAKVDLGKTTRYFSSRR